MTSSTASTRTTDGPADPTHPALWAALTYALCTLILAWPALGGGFLVNTMSDQYIGGWPVRDFAGQSLKAGQGIPHWNPYIFSGLPYIAAMHGDIFYPTALLRLIFPTDVGLTLAFVIHLFLAGCFTYGFLRAWGMRFHPALIGGVAYMLSGQIASLVSPGHDGKLFVNALLPLTLWTLVRGVRDGRRWAWGVLAIVIGLGVLSPHPQLLQYMLLVSGAFGLYLALSRRPDGTRLSGREGTLRLGMALGAVLLGAAMGAIQYLPVFGYVPYSPRAGGGGWEHAISYSMPLEEMINTYLPQFSGLHPRYWGRNGIHLHSEYLGASVMLLAGAAFAGAAAAGDERKSFRRFWLVTGFIALLWALGGNTPFYHLVYALVPGSKFFRAPSTIFYVVSFAVAVLAALGTERVLARAFGRRYLIGWLAAGGLVALLATAGLFTALGKMIAASYAGDQLDEVINANQTAVALGGWRSFLFVALTAGLLYAFASRRIDARKLAWGLVAVIALDLWSIDRHYWMFSPPARVLYASDPAIEFLQKAETGRVVVLAVSREGLVERDPYYGQGVGMGDGLMVHRIRSVLGYHGNELGRYQKLASGETPKDYRHISDPAFWRLTNARYLYTNGAIADSGLRQLLGPVKNSAGSVVYLYRLPGDNPPAWVTPAVVKVGDEAARGVLLDPRFDPLRVALVDSAAPVAAQTLSALPEPLGISARATRYDAGHIALELSGPAPAGSMLVMSENYYPGWSATVNGAAAPVVRADYTLIGVPLPAGATRVQLDFRDPAYGRGKAITIAATILALLIAVGGLLLEKRRRAGIASA